MQASAFSGCCGRIGISPALSRVDLGANQAMEVSFIAAFVAGMMSFLTPCVMPLVPGYISMLSGIGVEQLQQGEQPRGRLFASSLAFVSGFSVVFVSFGASA